MRLARPFQLITQLIQLNNIFFLEKESEEQKSGKPVDIVSAAIMAKILEEREKERQNIKHCGTCVCPLQRVFIDQACQTDSFHSFVDSENGQIFMDNNFFGNSKNHIVKVETYQSQSPSVSSAILIERTCVPIDNNNVNSFSNSVNNNDNNIGHGSQTLKKNEELKLNVGRNRYHSSKLSRGVNRSLCNPKKSEKSEDVGARNSEVHMDGSVRFSGSSLPNSKEVSIDIESLEGNKNSKSGPRRCSVSVQMGSSNILLDNLTCFTPVVPSQQAQPCALVHGSRSRSTSDSNSSNDDSSDSKPTETCI